MQQKLTALIVDDEEKALQLLNQLLEDTQQFSEIRRASSARLAGEAIKRFNPDLIFLDIKMPGQDGFSFLKELRHQQINAEIVFVTAHDQFALDALRSHAFGYLLKPVNREELSECIHHFKHRAKNAGSLERLGKFLESYEGNSKLRFNTRAGYVFIEAASILYCEAEGNYTNIQMGEKQHMCSLPLGSVEEILPGIGFLRLGRSLIINLTNVSRVDRKANQLTFEKDGQSWIIKVSKMQLRELEKKQDT